MSVFITFKIQINCMKFLILLSSVFFLSFQSDNSVALKTDGFYVGKIAEEYHYIYFHNDRTAETHVHNTLNIKNVYGGMMAKREPDFSGSYIIHAGNIIYRSNNSDNKKVKPSVDLFHTYKGKMNERGELVLWVNSTDGSKTEVTFDYAQFPKE